MSELRSERIGASLAARGLAAVAQRHEFARWIQAETACAGGSTSRSRSRARHLPSAVPAVMLGMRAVSPPTCGCSADAGGSPVPVTGPADPAGRLEGEVAAGAHAPVRRTYRQNSRRAAAGGRGRRARHGCRRPDQVPGTGGFLHHHRSAVRRGRYVRRECLGGRYRRRCQDPDPALERDLLEAGAQPDTRGAAAALAGVAATSASNAWAVGSCRYRQGPDRAVERQDRGRRYPVRAPRRGAALSAWLRPLPAARGRSASPCPAAAPARP